MKSKTIHKNNARIISNLNAKIKMKRKKKKKYLSKKYDLHLHRKYFKIGFITLLILLLLIPHKNKNTKLFDNKPIKPTNIVEKKPNNRHNNYHINNNKFNIKVRQDSESCKSLDPVFMLKKRLESEPIKICDNNSTKHICYNNKNTDVNIHNRFPTTNGVICTIENMIIDPSKWTIDNGTNPGNKGAPLLSKGFYNTKCDNQTIDDYGARYKQYFNAWDYEYKENMENVEELAPGKTIFLLSRNYDSGNMYHGGCEIINAISLMYILNLKPEDIKIIFLESFTMKEDPFFILYKNLVSRGGDPVHIRDLNKKYHISNAVLVPINYDSPSFLRYFYVPHCSKASTAYQFFNDLYDKYANVTFKDNFFSKNSSFYYPKSTIDHFLSNKNFTKSVTIQWRRLWPKNRKSQGRLMGNGPELADKLASILPKNILVRLVDTAGLNTLEQIAIAKNSDYFIGVHGAGLFLTIFTPRHCINHEIFKVPRTNDLRLMSSMSGHKTYANALKASLQRIEGSNYLFFDLDDFSNCIISKMKENNFF